jgi:hypothetical protein
VGSLKAFQAGGTRAYRDLFGWTDTVSASPLGVGALQCLWRAPFLAQYLATVALPLLAAGGVIAIFLAVTAARQVRCGTSGRGRAPVSAAEPQPARCGYDTVGLRKAVGEWWSQRRHVSTMMVRGQGLGRGRGVDGAHVSW